MTPLKQSLTKFTIKPWEVFTAKSPSTKGVTILWLVTLLTTFTAYSPSQSAEPCKSIASPNDIVLCAIEQHGMIRTQNAEIESRQLAAQAAGQMLNPELNLEGVKKKESGISAEFSLLHTFELGGKRGAREHLASQQAKLSKIELLGKKEQIILQLVENLVRLRHIKTDIEITQEIFDTYGSVSRQYRNTGRLNPEQQVSLVTFKVAMNESKLKRALLISEQQRMVSEIIRAIGRPLEIKDELLPSRTKKWPVLKPEKLNGSEIRIATKSVQLAEAKLEVEKSRSWPNLSVGPRVDFETGSNSEIRFGISLSLPLPIYHANGAGRAKAMTGVTKQKIQHEFAKKSLETQKENLYSIYNRAVTTLKSVLSKDEITGKHEKLHRLTKRGVISAPLILELHRQLFDYYEALHEQELQATIALWKIYALEGRILKEVLR